MTALMRHEDYSIELEVCCSKHPETDLNFSIHGKQILRVSPCPLCLEESYLDGFEKGKEE